MNRQRDVRLLWWLSYGIACAFLMVLAVKTIQRASFPWDMYLWPESPFLTDMMKLSRHQSVYSPPEDGNSFVYSPGLEYLCFGLLSPAGMELDIRWSRVISILLGIAASGCAALAILRLVRPATTRPWLYFLMCWGVVLLALAKNITFDVAHPDNLHVLHALLLFWLCFLAASTRKFGLAILVMVLAGVGLFAKQTAAVSFLGPALVFALLNPWGWRKSAILVAIGSIALAVSLALLWHPPLAKFYTWTLLTHQKVQLTRGGVAFNELRRVHHGLLQLLTVIASICLWRAGGRQRTYLICWLGVGFFVVLPPLAAFLKEEGAANNLILFRLWMFLLVLPFFALLLDGLALPDKSLPFFSILNNRAVQLALCLLTLLSWVWLWPNRGTPAAESVQYCRRIDALLRDDILAQRKVMVSHGTTFLIHTGTREIPRDRSNSISEMSLGGMRDFPGMEARLAGRYYDKIYLTANWYGPELVRKINENYKVESEIKGCPVPWREGFQTDLMDGCQVMVRRSD